MTGTLIAMTSNTPTHFSSYPFDKLRKQDNSAFSGISGVSGVSGNKGRRVMQRTQTAAEVEVEEGSNVGVGAGIGRKLHSGNLNKFNSANNVSNSNNSYRKKTPAKNFKKQGKNGEGSGKITINNVSLLTRNGKIESKLQKETPAEDLVKSQVSEVLYDQIPGAVNAGNSNETRENLYLKLISGEKDYALFSHPVFSSEKTVENQSPVASNKVDVAEKEQSLFTPKVSKSVKMTVTTLKPTSTIATFSVKKTRKKALARSLLTPTGNMSNMFNSVGTFSEESQQTAGNMSSSKAKSDTECESNLVDFEMLNHLIRPISGKKPVVSSSEKRMDNVRPRLPGKLKEGNLVKESANISNGKFAWSKLQSSPDPKDLPIPSFLRMNSNELSNSGLSTSLKTVQNSPHTDKTRSASEDLFPEVSSVNERNTPDVNHAQKLANLKKMLGLLN